MQCGFNSTAITAQLAQLGAAAGVFTHAAAEDYDLCANGTACKKTRRSAVSARLAALNISAQAMIVSWDLDEIRAAFAAPQAFIASVLAIFTAEPALAGVNIDFEPHGTNPPVGPAPTAADAAAFAALLDATADAVHAVGKTISVDIATWTPFWDYGALNRTRVDWLCDMESYNADFAFFKKQVAFAMAHVAPEKYVCGLATTHESGPNSGKPFNDTELAWRFDFLRAQGVQKIAMWDTPLPANWLPFLAAFAAAPGGGARAAPPPPPALPSHSRLSLPAAQRVARFGRPSVDGFTFLENGVIRLGIDTSRGGALGWLGPVSNRSLSVLNIHDFGRVVQGSFYSGPMPFNPGGKCSEPGGWGQPWPWNPIGAGDVYLHPAPILNITVSPDKTAATVWTQPMQWACDNVPCDCLFEQRIALVGGAVNVTLTLHANREDVTFYPGQTQELPAVYVVGDFCHLHTYNGSRPFSGGAAAEGPAAWGANAWSSFTSGERWMAFTNASGWGVGVVSPNVAHFGAGFFNDGARGVYNCTPKGLGPYDDPTGYIAPWGSEIIDPKAPLSYSFALVLGTLGDIRAFATAAHSSGAAAPLAPDYRFAAAGNRAHCVFHDAIDGGLPVGGDGLVLNVTGPHPTIEGPISVWAPSDAPTIVVNASLDASLVGTTAALWFVPFGAASECPTCVALAPVVADGRFHEVVFNLGAVPEYAAAAAITQVLFQPLGAAPVPPAVVGVPGLVRVSSVTTRA